MRGCDKSIDCCIERPKPIVPIAAHSWRGSVNEERWVAELDAELRSLADQDPAEAIHKSRALLSGSTNQQSVAAGVLIDAGALTKDSQAIQEGVQVFRELSQKYPESHGFRYNLANGLVTLADTVPFQNLDWYLETSALRREGRSLFERVAANRDCGDELRSTAACNLAKEISRCPPDLLRRS